MSVHHKAAIRARVWRELRAVAVPDSRFHLDFSRFIADFQGSRAANDALLAQPCLAPCRDSDSCVFVAPDNCLEYLRERLLRAGITVLTTTYGIRRGFWLLEPARIAAGGDNDDPSLLFRYAATLDGMERVGTPVSLRDMVGLRLRVGMMVTGTGAINDRGVRFGKGHGFFDLEWGMLSAVGLVSNSNSSNRADADADVTAATVVAAVVHDCQLLEGEALVPERFDTVCDLVATPTRLVWTEAARKPDCGILWDRLEPGMLEDIPPLRELRDAPPGRATPAA